MLRSQPISAAAHPSLRRSIQSKPSLDVRAAVSEHRGRERARAVAQSSTWASALLSDCYSHHFIIDLWAIDWLIDILCLWWRSTSARPSAWRCQLRMRRSWRKARSQTQHPRGSWVKMRRMKGKEELDGAPRIGRSDLNHCIWWHVH